MAEEKPVQIAQISFFLAKPGRTFETVLNADKTTQQATTLFDFEFEGAMFRFLYFETVSRKSNPPWLDFVNDRMPRSDRIAFVALSKSPNGVLLIEIEDQVFAAAFGRSASSCLDDAGFEPDFGIKTAMNLCGNEEIRQTRSQSNTITPTQIDRQVGKPADTLYFRSRNATVAAVAGAHKGHRSKQAHLVVNHREMQRVSRRLSSEGLRDIVPELQELPPSFGRRIDGTRRRIA